MKEIIVLDKVIKENYFEVSYVFWLSVPANQQALRVNAGATSLYKDATADELNALKDGSVVEESGTASYSTNTAIGAIGADLISKYNARQTALNAEVKFNYYGTSWDGSTWTIKGV